MDYASIWGNGTLDAVNLTSFSGNDSFTNGSFEDFSDIVEYEQVITITAVDFDAPTINAYEFVMFGNRHVAKVPPVVQYLQIYGFVSAPVNSFGAFVILRGSTEAMSGYKWHPLNFQLWSSVFEFIMCSLLTNLPEFQDVLDFSWARFYGLLTQFGASLVVCAMFMVVPVVFLFLSIAQCFAYCHQTLLGADSKLQPKTFNRVLLAVHALVFLGVSIVFNRAYRVYVDEVTEVRSYDMDENYENYYEMNPNIVSKAVLIPAMSLLVGGMVLIVTLTISSTYMLMSSGQNLSAKTRSMQWSFIRVLCVQTGMPIFVIVLPLMYRLVRGANPPRNEGENWEERLEHDMEPITLFMWAAIHCHGLLSTFTLLFLKPYRDYLWKLLRVDKFMNRFIVNIVNHGSAPKISATKSVSLADSSGA